MREHPHQKPVACCLDNRACRRRRCCRLAAVFVAIASVCLEWRSASARWLSACFASGVPVRLLEWRGRYQRACKRRDCALQAKGYKDADTRKKHEEKKQRRKDRKAEEAGGSSGLWRCNDIQLKKALAEAGFIQTEGWTKQQMIQQIRKLRLEADKVSGQEKREGSPDGNRASYARAARKPRDWGNKRERRAPDLDNLVGEDKRTGRDRDPERRWQQATQGSLHSVGSASAPRASPKVVDAEAAMKRAFEERWLASQLTTPQALALMGLQEPPDEEEARAVRKRMALRWHPDRHAGDAGAAHAFQLAMAACDVFL
eukprot:TRINITY_DN59398_c0_g1_i1.p1 TRINITY_DN59398_c0_g1~~TRINITY_DN59398_c0_g1_i1.p1  ORF type:complete len:315 (+),score=72.32 TRINITY_DN59398_c0_g1_i1:103-1047(+)